MIDARVMTDAQARARALEVTRSFIVQAPAGSGKTELLIQRYLALLARVDAPEEIVAITFTRKAATEMRNRVITALRNGPEAEAPGEPHRQATLMLAQSVAARDRDAEWGLAENPNRLRIQTIDALCASLTRQLPVLSGFGAQPRMIEKAEPLYRDAARRAVAGLDREAWSPLVARLLAHLDNDVGNAQALIARMLARRDQWLRHVAGRGSSRLARARLESGLANVTRDALAGVTALLPASARQELAPLAAFAAEHLEAGGRDSPIRACGGRTAAPGAGLEELDAWRGIAELLLTQQGEPRRSFNEAVGFPAPTGATGAERQRRENTKQRMISLARSLAPHRTFIALLHETRILPPLQYSDAQWEVVEALAGLLPVAAGLLRVVFQERGEVDFTEISQSAVRALGEHDSPTDLALALDCRIRHILVDEFQDTSFSQYELLERLTAGWEAGDGRTLFVVGDPMQSIYRFREAEVGLYLRARKGGIGGVALEPITLSSNFRSQAGIVAWVNATFQAVLPDEEDLASGAVPFVKSEPARPALGGEAVAFHGLLTTAREPEARRVAELVRSARAENPEQTIAILVRNRSHLAAIAPKLKEAGLRFQAIEIEELGHRPVVQDLAALTRALTHPADRIAWLALLRAPWCGMTLADLDTLAARDHDAAVWTLMTDAAIFARLSEDGRMRLDRVRVALGAALASRRREPLRRWIEAAWLALGGPACAERAADLEDAQVFLKLLEDLDEGGDLRELDALDERVAALYAAPDADADARLQVMTIHKAKGLEFGTVIVPGLGYAPRPREPQLLAWLERARGDAEPDLLLAPIRDTAADQEPIYRYLRALDDIKEKHEDARLIYVSATRAISRLHLIGQVKPGANRPSPRARSLLALLWPVVTDRFVAGAPAHAAPQEEDAAPGVHSHAIRRLVSGWKPPAPPPDVASRAHAEFVRGTAHPHEEVEFSWASETAKHVGTVVHRFLQLIAREGLERWDAARIASLHAVYARDLACSGVPAAEMSGAVARVAEALARSLADERGRWVLAARPEAQSEYRLTGVLAGEIVSVAMDRTFLDERGVRWIVDYKTGAHEGADVDAFLDREQERYRAQLERYAALMHAAGGQPIRLGLYFPLLSGWREWEG